MSKKFKISYISDEKEALCVSANGEGLKLKVDKQYSIGTEIEYDGTKFKDIDSIPVPYSPKNPYLEVKTAWGNQTAREVFYPNYENTKTFKVLPTAPGKMEYLCVAKDAECWQIKLESDRNLQSGNEIEVPLKESRVSKISGEKTYSPLWKSIGATDPVALRLKTPFETVAFLWGEKTAADKFIKYDEGYRAILPQHKIEIENFMFSSNSTMSDTEQKDTVIEIVSFIVNSFDKKRWTPEIYDHISKMFDFEREESLESFYKKWFSTADCKISFLRHIVSYVVPEDPKRHYADMEKIIRNWVANYALGPWERTSKKTSDRREREKYIEMFKKYGVPDGYKISN